MFFEIPKGYTDSGYLWSLGFYLWWLVVVVFLLSMCIFFYKGMKDYKKKEDSFIIYITIGFISVAQAISRFFFLISFYFSDSYEILTILGYLTIQVGFIVWFFILEWFIVKKTKLFFTFILISLFVISLFILFIGLGIEIALSVLYIFAMIAGFFLLFLYIYYILITTGKPRIKACLILIGLIFFYISTFLDSAYFVSNYPNFPFIIAPIGMVLGLICFHSQFFV